MVPALLLQRDHSEFPSLEVQNPPGSWVVLRSPGTGTPIHTCNNPVQTEPFQTRKKGRRNSSGVRSSCKITPKTCLTPTRGSSRASSGASQDSREQSHLQHHHPPCPQAAIHKIRAQQKTRTETSTHTSNRRKTILLTALSFPRYLQTLIC